MTEKSSMGRPLSAAQNRALTYALNQHKDGNRTFILWPEPIRWQTINSLVEMGVLIRGTRKITASKRHVTFRVSPKVRKALSS